MSVISSSRRSTGGSGGVTIAGWQNDQLVQTANFSPNTVSVPLSETPISEDAIVIDYNGQVLRLGESWEYNSGTNSIEIIFGDPYVTTYDTPPYFQVTYPYS